MNRLEHGRELVGGVDAAGGGVAHAAHHGAGLIGQNVAKEVVGENHIETARVGDQEDGGRINVLVVVGASGYSSPTLSTMRCHISPA